MDDIRIVFIMICLISTVSSLTMIEIKLTKYTNAVGRRQDGKCCDPLCGTACDQRLTVCLDDAHRTSCGLLKHITDEYRNQNIIVFQNEVMTYTFQKWPGSVALNVRIIDEDLMYNDVIDTMHSQLRLTTPDDFYNIRWRSKTITGQRARNPTKLYISFTVHCVHGWHGNTCSRLKSQVTSLSPPKALTSEEYANTEPAQHESVTMTSSTLHNDTENLPPTAEKEVSSQSSLVLSVLVGVLVVGLAISILVIMHCWKRKTQARSSDPIPSTDLEVSSNSYIISFPKESTSREKSSTDELVYEDIAD